MYEFIDTTQVQNASSLPAEAVKFNGVWLDQKVPGFRTLHVSGRELIECEIADDQMGSMDGTQYQYKRYPSRTITVTYQLIAESDTAFREAYNQLNGLLDAEQAELLFNDETDKYFIATKASNSEVSPGMNHVTGDICFYCTDPRKYSTTEKTFQASLNEDGILEATIVNNGTESVPISYEITHNDDNGYIGIVSEHGAMQYGLVKEADGENYQQNEMLATLEDFFDAPDDVNGTDVMHPSHGVKGTLADATWFGNRFLKFGTKGDAVGAANGGLRTIEIPADSNGEKGCRNFYSYFHLIFYAGAMGQTGEMCINWLTEDNKMIAGVNWYKTDTSGNTGYYELWANGKLLKTYAYTTSHLHSQNPWYWDWGHCDLRKEGNRLTFFYWANYPSYVIPEIEGMECAKIQIAIKQYGDRSGAKLMTHMGINVFHFQKLHVEKWRDVPNRYQPGDVLSIDGDTTKAYVNGMPRLDDEIVGTKPFLAPPGETKVQFCYSDFCETAPSVTARIREAYL